MQLLQTKVIPEKSIQVRTGHGDKTSKSATICSAFRLLLKRSSNTLTRASSDEPFAGFDMQA
jgi:hypothetical protein